MNLHDRALYTDVGGWNPVPLHRSAQWFQALRSGGKSSVNQAAAMLIARMDHMCDDNGFVGPMDEPMAVPSLIGLGTPEMNRDVPNVFHTVVRQIVHFTPAMRFLPTDPDILDTYTVMNVYLALRKDIGAPLYRDTSDGTMRLAVDKTYQELERLLVGMEGDYMCISHSWFDRMDHLTSFIATAEGVSPRMAVRFYKAGNQFVLWGARLQRELRAA